jgi:ABC-type antimicrobial peptide transport system permease subunit
MYIRGKYNLHYDIEFKYQAVVFMKRQSLSFLMIAYLLSTAILLSSCTQITSLFNGDTAKPAHAKHTAKPRPYYDADAYVSNLTLSRLILSAGPEHADEITDNIAVIDGYAAQKKHTKTEQLTIIIIDYQIANDSSTKQIVAPIHPDKDDYASLKSVMDKFDNTHGTIHNIHLASVSIRPDTTLALPKDPAQIMPALDSQQQHLLAQSHALNPTADIKTQLALIDFFTKHHFQDAAYLSVDNVKRLLGKAVSNHDIDDSALQTFSQNLETLESNLKAELPYKF